MEYRTLHTVAEVPFHILDSVLQTAGEQTLDLLLLQRNPENANTEVNIILTVKLSCS